MEYVEIRESDERTFHELLNAYYREGEDAATPQEEVDAFIRFLFDQALSHAVEGRLAMEGKEYVGFALWTVDAEGAAFSEMPGYGTILEIGLIPSRRSSGRGQALVSYIEDWFRDKNVKQCYVSAYGPARSFWARCGYADCGKKAENGLPILVKTLV